MTVCLMKFSEEETMDSNSVYGKAKRSFLLLAVLCIATVCISFSDAFAWRGGGYGGGRSDRYYFHSGRYYHPGRLWYDVAVGGEVRHPGPGFWPQCASGGVAWRLL